MVKQTVKEALILIFIAVGIALAVYAVRPDLMARPPASVNQPAGELPTTESSFAEISIEEAARLYEEESVIFVDARHADDYEAGHIKGAVNLYAMDQDTWLSGFLYATDPTFTIVTYCDGESCHLATELAELLYMNGYNNIFYLRNGWSQWREGGFPTEGFTHGQLKR